MVEVEGLVVSYDQVRAVDGLTLEVPKGCLFGLLGPNGAGKSTTISAIGVLIAPSAGKVTVGGVDVARDPLAARRRLGIAPQSLALFPNLTVKQNLQVFGGLFGLGGRKLTERTSWGLQLAHRRHRR